MSAALVESVRDTVDAEESVEIHRVHGTPGVPPLALISRAQMLRAKLDLPAILAALTEADALRAFRDDALKQVRELDAQRAAGQAREVALRKALGDAVRDSGRIGWEHNAVKALSAPTDTAALRAMLEKTVMATAQYIVDNQDAFDAQEFYDLLANPDYTDRANIVDRVLGGS